MLANGSRKKTHNIVLIKAMVFYKIELFVVLFQLNEQRGNDDLGKF